MTTGERTHGQYIGALRGQLTTHRNEIRQACYKIQNEMQKGLPDLDKISRLREDIARSNVDIEGVKRKLIELGEAW